MFSSFKRKSSGSAEPTFKQRVQEFWEWYAEVAPRFFKTIEADQCTTLTEEVSAKVDVLLPGFAWVFGQGDGGKGHSFTLSGEGNPHFQLLSIYWYSLAPKLTGWTFFASRQPGAVEGFRISTEGGEFNPLELWLTPILDREREKVEITAWHPLFGTLNEQARLQALFLLLDEVLGEYGTGQWLGEIKLNDKRLADSIPLRELPAFLKKVQTESGWKKLPPGEAFTSYTYNERHDRFLRGDVITGTTMQPKLIREYLTSEGELADPLAGTDADYAFVAFDARVLSAGQQAVERGAIENAIEKALKLAKNGRVLGGAHGTRFAYIDLLLFDGDNSLEIVKRVLRERGLPAGTTINFFAKEKRQRRLTI